ncbi:unnamed protein product, partial [Rotaria sp. Silwood1]
PSYSILNRFRSQILPKIHHKVKWLNLESSSMASILLCTNYPNLNRLGLYNLEIEKAKYLFTNEILLFHIFKNEILSLIIHINQNDHRSDREEMNTFIFTHIFTMFNNLQYLDFVSSSYYYQQLSFNYSPPRIFSSNLLELYVTLKNFTNCLYLLDGRFNQLHTFHVNIDTITPHLKIDNKAKLPNLKCFVLNCFAVLHAFDGIIVSLLYRMSNLEELTLNLVIFGRSSFIDGNNLKNIINHMSKLNKFTFNIHSSIYLDNQIDLPSNENIQNTLKNLTSNKIISCVDYFSEAGKGECLIYSSPYTLKEYNNITNNFQGGLFECVREISLFDERPFEHEFFLLVAQSFPLIKKLTLNNLKPQKNKQCTKSKDDKQDFSIIIYPHLTYLNLNEIHEDYIEQFLDDTKTYLPNNMNLATNHELLEKVTHNFKRDTTKINCSRINYLYDSTVLSLPKHLKHYFLHLCQF